MAAEDDYPGTRGGFHPVWDAVVALAKKLVSIHELEVTPEEMAHAARKRVVQLVMIFETSYPSKTDDDPISRLRFPSDLIFGGKPCTWDPDAVPAEALFPSLDGTEPARWLRPRPSDATDESRDLVCDEAFAALWAEAVRNISRSDCPDEHVADCFDAPTNMTCGLCGKKWRSWSVFGFTAAGHNPWYGWHTTFACDSCNRPLIMSGDAKPTCGM
jgi:hypothetical protein